MNTIFSFPSHLDLNYSFFTKFYFSFCGSWTWFFTHQFFGYIESLSVRIQFKLNYGYLNYSFIKLSNRLMQISSHFFLMMLTLSIYTSHFDFSLDDIHTFSLIFCDVAKFYDVFPHSCCSQVYFLFFFTTFLNHFELKLYFLILENTILMHTLYFKNLWMNFLMKIFTHIVFKFSIGCDLEFIMWSGFWCRKEEMYWSSNMNNM